MLAASARADTLTGQVVTPAGVGVVGATLTFSNGANPLNPVTGTNGIFAVVLPPGTYDIGIDPPSGSGLAPRELIGVVVSGLTNIGTIQLEPGFALSGRVVTTAGLPVVNADTDVRDLATGRRLFTPDDNTDANGAFQVVVPAGTYRFDVRPNPATLIAPGSVQPVVVAAATSLGTIVLEPGFALTGTVLDGRTSTPLEGADIDVEDAVTGARLLTPSDNTDPLGRFSVVVPAGFYVVSVDPPPGTPLRGLERFNVSVAGTATSLGTLALAAGFVVSGTVLDSTGAPVAGTDIDVETTPGSSAIFVSNDKTDANGNFAVVVPGGTWRVVLEPQRATGLVGHRSAPLPVSANVTLPTVRLQSGVVLSGTVTGAMGTPEENVDIDVVDPATGEELVTDADDTDASGRYSVIVPPGTWDLRFLPAKASPSRVEQVQGVAVQGATTVDRQLSLVPIFAYLDTLGVPEVGQGGPLPVLIAFINATPVTQPTTVRIVVVDPFGNETDVLPALRLDMPSGAGAFTALQIGIPTLHSTLPGQPYRLELRFDDPATGAEQDHDNLRFLVR